MYLFLQLVLSIALSLLASALMPRPKAETPPASDPLEAPTADAGRPIPVIFGDLIVKDPNCLWFGDISIRMKKVKL